MKTLKYILLATLVLALTGCGVETDQSATSTHSTALKTWSRYAETQSGSTSKTTDSTTNSSEACSPAQLKKQFEAADCPTPGSSNDPITACNPGVLDCFKNHVEPQSCTAINDHSHESSDACKTARSAIDSCVQNTMKYITANNCFPVPGNPVPPSPRQ